jgi:methionyl-tRNA formyltransferase
MITCILATEKSWHDKLFKNLSQDDSIKWIRLSSKEDLNYENLKEIEPKWVFIPHWSYIISKDVFENYNCVVFHMTDLPFGRGGSPLQNLIVRGFAETKISAIRVSDGLDSGKIYLKRDLNLNGSAQEIFIRSADIIEEMIKEIISSEPIPVEQVGEPTIFKRRKPEDGDISELVEIEDVFNFIRMLDCEGYPNAFLTITDIKYEFSHARLKADGSIVADVRITKK